MKKSKLFAAVTAALLLVMSACLFLAGCGGPEPTAITVDESKAKLVYEVGEEFDYTGLSVSLRYDDGSVEAVDPSACTYSGFDSSVKKDGQVITVSYEGLSTTYSVTITKTVENANKVFYGQSKEVEMNIMGQVTVTTYDSTIEIVDDETLIYGSDIMMGVWGYFDCSYTENEDGSIDIVVEGNNLELTAPVIFQTSFANNTYEERKGLLHLTVRLEESDEPIEIMGTGTDSEGNTVEVVVDTADGTFEGLD